MSTMETTPYPSGATVRSSAVFDNGTGVLTDPVTVAVNWQYGAGGQWQPGTFTRDSAGLYHCEVPTAGWTGPGFQQVSAQWIGTNAENVVTDEFFDRFLVQPDASAATDAVGP
jgi:hypothetical protein